ncbi:hypothetical protein Tco_0209658 [Tanacetum coccineum]
MKELYDKVQESIKDSFKDFIPMGSEKEREMLKEREAKRLLRKRKATISEEQPSKKLKLRTETVDEIRNYLRIVDFEKSAQDKESLERGRGKGISMINRARRSVDNQNGLSFVMFLFNEALGGCKFVDGADHAVESLAADLDNMIQIIRRILYESRSTLGGSESNGGRM